MQTTIPFAEDDWHIGRFSLLRDELASLKDDAGNPLYEVTTRDRELDEAGNDPVLSALDTTDFNELWLFAIDQGDGLTVADCQGITRFRQRGGGIMATRDHEDLGTSLCTLGGIGRAAALLPGSPFVAADTPPPRLLAFARGGLTDFVPLDLRQGRLSIESPMAQALMGRAPGDDVRVSTPRGPQTYRIERLGT